MFTRKSEGATDPFPTRCLYCFVFFIFFNPAFLCRCGKQPTSAVIFFEQRNLKLKQNIQVLSSRIATVRRERRKRGRDREMTISLFFSTLISLEDK